MLASNAYAAGKIAEAEAACARILEEKPDDFEALHLRGRCRQRVGDFYGAEIAIWQALRADPGSIDAQLSYGEVLLDLGNTQEATTCLERATALDPVRVDVQFRLGMAYERVGRYGDAMACYEFTRRHGGEARSIQGLANCLLGLGRIDEAITAYEELLQSEPSRADLHANLAVARARRGDHRGALTSIERALALRPDFAEAKETRAFLILQLAKGQPQA